VSQIAKRRAAAASSAEDDSAYRQKQWEILQAAGRVFHRLGYQTTKLTDIAVEAGLDRASLYYYYGSKEQLFRDVASRAVIGNIEATEEIVSSASLSAAEKLARVIEVQMTSFESNYPFLYVLVQEDVSKWLQPGAEISEWKEAVHGWSARFFTLVRGVISEGIESGEFHTQLPAGVIAHCAIGMMNNSSTWFKPEGVLTAREIARGMSELFLAGLVSPLSGSQRPR